MTGRLDLRWIRFTLDGQTGFQHCKLPTLGSRTTGNPTRLDDCLTVNVSSHLFSHDCAIKYSGVVNILLFQNLNKLIALYISLDLP